MGRGFAFVVFIALVATFTSPVTAQNQQSPIKLFTPNSQSTPVPHPLQFAYGNNITLSTVVHTPAGGHRGVEAFPAATTNTLTINNETFRLQRFHFHHTAEHTLDLMNPFAMEMHMVHIKVVNGADVPGDHLVVGRWITPGVVHNEMDKIIKAANQYPINNLANFDLTTLIPGINDRGSWRYNGSLTTGEGETFQEGVRWVMLRNELTMTAQQIANFSALWPANVRAPRDAVAAHNLVTDLPEPGCATLFVMVGIAALRRTRRMAA
jgi:carbonic anhydrase